MSLEQKETLVSVAFTVAIILWVWFATNRRRPLGHWTRPKSRRATVHHSSEAVEQVRQSDQDFLEDGFLDHVRLVFDRIQKAWIGQEIEPIAPLISDGLHERFLLQIEHQKQDGWRWEIVTKRWYPPQVVASSEDPHFVSVTVRVSSQISIHPTSLTDQSIPSDIPVPSEKSVELWTFLRRREATSKTVKGWKRGTCPSCAAPVELLRSAKCSACGSWVRSGVHDWVLVKTDKVWNWCRRPAPVAGLEDYRRRDSGISVQHLEDRTSVIFWRLASAGRRGDTEPIKKLATPEFCETYGDAMSPPLEGHHHTARNHTLFSVHVLALMPGSTKDRAVVEIRWSAILTRQKKGTVVGQVRPRRRSLFVLIRESGVASEVDSSLSSAHCPACGATEAPGADDQCSSCGVASNRGTKDWVLQAVHSPSSHHGIALLREVQEQLGEDEIARSATTLDVLSWIARALQDDRELGSSHLDAFRTLATKCQVPPSLLESLVGEEGDAEIMVRGPQDSKEAQSWIQELLKIGFTDGSLSQAEQQMVNKVAAQFGVSGEDLKDLSDVAWSQQHYHTDAAKRRRKRRIEILKTEDD